MKKILIICGSCSEISFDPASKEIYTLFKELSNKYDVSLLTTYNYKSEIRKYSWGKVFYIRDPKYYYNRFMDRLKKSKSIIFDHFTKLFYNVFKKKKSYTEHFFKAWLKKNKEKYDLIISVSNPFFYQKFGYMTNMTVRAKKWIVYMLDPYADSEILINDVNKRIESEEQCFKECSNIFTTKLIYDSSEKSTIKRFSDKVSFVPDVFINDRTNYEASYNKKTVLGYFGGFYPKIREPDAVLKILSLLNEEYIVNIYSRGCESVIEQYSKFKNNIVKKDLIHDNKQYDDTITKTDILLSVGNNLLNQTPSKVFEYCSYGKPIIHFYYSENDDIIKRFSKYPLIEFISCSEEPNRAMQKVVDFCNKYKAKKVDYYTIKSIFPDYTIDYIINLIGTVIG